MVNFSRTELDAALAYLRGLPEGGGREVSRSLKISNSTVNGWIKKNISPTGARAERLVDWHKALLRKSDNSGQRTVRESPGTYLAGERSATARAMFLEGVLFATAGMHEAIVDIHRRARSEPWPPTASAAEVEEALRRDLEDDGGGESGGRTGTG